MTIGRMHIGNCSFQIGASGSGSSEPTPSPYFMYDENRVITGLYQGEPNIRTIDGGGAVIYWTYGGSNVVEDYATAIGNNAFNNGDYVMMSIPPSKEITGNITFQNVTSIGSSAFNFCSQITSITIPNVTSIGYAAFGFCYGLTNVTLPNVTSIGEDAFYECGGLTSLTIGSRIQRIGNNAFNTYSGNPVTLTIGKTADEVRTMGTIDYDQNTNVPYSKWDLPSGSTIVCTDRTINV